MLAMQQFFHQKVAATCNIDLKFDHTAPKEVDA